MSNYDQKNIQILEDREAVRSRPGMYIGSTSKTGAHHLIWEIVNNSVDEAMAGHGDTVKLTIQKDGSIKVEDFGRGIPVENHDKSGKSTLETIFTVLHSGGKFDDSVYKTSSGLHGVGATVTNFLSEYLTVRVKRNGKIHEIKFEEGIITQEIKVVGECPENETGTEVVFKPSINIFSEVEFDIGIINNYLEMQSYLLKGLRFEVVDEIQEETYEFYSENGLLDYLEKNTEEEKTICKPIYIEGAEKFQTRKGEERELELKVAFQWIGGNNSGFNSFVNGAHTTGGGSHVEGFKNGIKRTIDKWLNFKKIKIKSLSKDDLFVGIESIISANFFEPEFEGQTKGILGTREVLSPTSQIIFDKFYEFLEQNPEVAEKIVKKIEFNVKLRLASENAQKSLKQDKTLMKKMIDRYWGCASRNPIEKELYVVEGSSAAGSLVDSRDPKTQAVLGLRGVVKNIEGLELKDVLKNAEIQTILNVLDCGIKNNYKEEDLKFHKFIIACDEDPDGKHIVALIITFLYRYMPKLFENGHVYMTVAPFYKIEYKGKKHYFYNDKERDEFLSKNPTKNAITRFKGLGEMNADEAGIALCSPETRKLRKINVEDAESMSKTISDLMGGNSKPKFQLLKEMEVDRELL